MFGILLQLLHNSSNFKIRIQAAAALAVPLSVQGSVFSYQIFINFIPNIYHQNSIMPCTISYIIRPCHIMHMKWTIVQYNTV